MAGSWLDLVRGFGGQITLDGIIHFSPRMPKTWRQFSFKLHFKGRVLRVSNTKEACTYELIEGEPITVIHYTQRIELTPTAPIAVSNLPRLEEVVVNLDGLLVDLSGCLERAWRKLCSELRIDFSADINLQLRRLARLEAISKLLDIAGISLGEEERMELAVRKHRWYRDEIEHLTATDILPGAVKFLDEVKASGIKIAVTSRTKQLHDILERIGISSKFDLVLEGNDIKLDKPDPESFLLAAERLDVRIENCLGIDRSRPSAEALDIPLMKLLVIGEGMLSTDGKPLRNLGDINFKSAENYFYGRV